ncbi:hypothetical protein JOF56_004796 [Kibdelosporangium banguiense]|uniref:Nucleotide exchange factor GrpE n=1 Tax=Kibdelosporangium banguiense TaxID=1365924 RepID=A0ABS4TJ79_9PSEU|nr:hypothetical protein [Kibdelosporangium banguiense]MBP2324411.1 hypothetical protein [Kibdelosporangium banguiense]
MILGRLRQWRFPPEFRIPDSYPEIPPAPQEDTEPADVVMADLATNLWRVTKKLTGEQNGDAARGRRMASRHAQAAQESLAEAGIQIQDHDGTPFHPGLSLDVIAYEARPGTASETVVETVRPSIYRAGRCIQTGQVIVAQPEGVQQHDA